MKIKLALLSCLLFASFASFAGIETKNKRHALAAYSASGFSSDISDDKFTGLSGWTSGFTNFSNYAKVELKLDENLRVFHNAYFRTVITFDVDLTDASLTVQNLTGKTIEITYDPGAGTRYIDKAQLVWNSIYKMKVKNVSVVTYNAAASVISNPSDVFLELEISTNRIYDFSTSSALTGFNYTLTSNNELQPRWHFIPGAEEYELEWTYVDDYTKYVGAQKAAASVSYDLEHDATRIITNENHYNIPLNYDKGYIVYRIRPVGRSSTNTRIDGAWTTVPVSGTVAAAQTASSVSVYNITASLTGNSINWSSHFTFMEAGLQSAGVEYADGLLMGRQSVLVTKTNNKNIAQSVLYDYYGRPVINTLPAPVETTDLSYVENLNLYDNSGTIVSFDKTIFDVCGSCTTSAFPMDSVHSAGAGKYYSTQNTNTTDYQGYVPLAKGFAYTQTQFMSDPLGRVARQTLPGLTHQLNGGKEVKYYYSKPTQVELDRLFGSEAGLCIQYQKNYVVDPNGQISATYIDGMGHTVATALVGDEPSNLDAVGDKTAGVKLVDNMASYNMVQNGPDNYCLEVNTSAFVAYPNESQALIYSTSLGTFIPEECSSTLCLDCVYDFQLSITDDCGNNVLYDDDGNSGTPPVEFGPLNITVGPSAPYVSNCEGPTTTLYELSATDITLVFPNPGTYTISKKMCVSNKPVDDYTDLYLANDACGLSYCSFFNTQLAAADFSDCNPCADCEAKLTEYQYLSEHPEEIPEGQLPVYFPVLTPEEQQALLDECNELCNPVISPCEIKRLQLLHDFIPGVGQYAATDNTSPFWGKSIFNGSNTLNCGVCTIYKWNSPPAPYDPSTIMLDGTITNVTALTEAEFASNWHDSWAESWLTLHPDSCQLHIFCDEELLKPSMDYDQAMAAIDDFDVACALGYFNPIPSLSFTYAPPCTTSVADPFPSAATAFGSEMNDIQSSGNTIYEQATILAGYGSVPSGHTLGSDFCTRDEEWIRFRNLYLQMKQKAYENIFKSHCNVQISEPYHTNFPNLSDIFNDFDTDYSSDPGGVVNDDLAASCADACLAYSSVWLSNLESSCAEFAALTTTNKQTIIDDLVQVCMLGCDVEHPSGSTDFPTASTGYTIPGSSSVVVHSFQEVIDYYMTSSCTTVGITAPAPYNYSGTGTGTAKLDNCGCDKLLQVKYDFDNNIDVPSGTLNAKQLFKHRYGYELGDFNKLTCACQSVLSGTWTSSYSWSSTEIGDLADKNIAAPPTLRCDVCVTCTQVEAAMTTLMTGSSLSYSVPDELDAFIALHPAEVVNTLNYTFNVNHNLQEFTELMKDCHQFNEMSTLHTSTYLLKPEAKALEGYLTDLADDHLLNTDHEMSLCKDPQYYLSSLYTGALPAFTVYNYDRAIFGSTLAIDINDATNTINICSVSLALPALSPITWDHVVSITNLRAYAASLTAGPNYGFMVTVTDDAGNTEDVIGSNSCWPVFELSPGAVHEPMLCPSEPVVNPNQCAIDIIHHVQDNAQAQYDAYIIAHANAFKKAYKEHCLAALEETFLRGYTFKEYHYTLYYYDQAGNLVRTVAPAGVTPLLISAALPATPLVYPDHSLAGAVNANYVNEYHYNSYNQALTGNSVDGGLTHFFYDHFGRIIASQNAQQAIGGKYTYTIYDNLGRVKEVGEMNTATAPGSDLTYAIADDAALFATWMSTYSVSREQVNYTYYDAPLNVAADAEFGANGQQNLRNRVAAVAYEDVYDNNDNTYKFATHYSYDEHGNVIRMVEENISLDHLADQRYKLIDYDFDLVSGDVKQVTYQQDKADQIMYKYAYDDDNRLHEAFSSRDNINWDRDAKYFYYDHGPKARVEYADKNVQGADHYYTIQGWIKGINSNILTTVNDPGKDALVPIVSGSGLKEKNGYFARDAYGFSLNYFYTSTDNDYIAIKSPAYSPTDANPLADMTNLYASNSYFYTNNDAPALFNGNISSMVTSIVDKDPGNNITDDAAAPQITGYRYDQLQRLKQMKAFRSMNSNQWDEPKPSNYDDSYYTVMQYDPNGNITTNFRNGAGPAIKTGSHLDMDDLVYTYDITPTRRTNQLICVSDNPTFTSYYTGTDIDDQGSCTPGEAGTGNFNYEYNAIGSMISDKKEGIGFISWTVDHKIMSIERDPAQLAVIGAAKPDLQFEYNAQRQRVVKIEKPRDNVTYALKDQRNWIYTYYNYDASGNVIAVYERTFDNPSAGNYMDKYDLKELTLYGNKRLGIMDDNAGPIATRDFTATFDFYDQFTGITYGTPPDPETPPNGTPMSRTLGGKRLELANHLGNVLTVVSDRKLQEEYGADVNTNSISDYYTPDIISYTDYYSFGMEMPQRSYAPTASYRYGFNGKENDVEAKGNGNQQDYGMRIYDPRLGKFLSADPIAPLYPELTPYQFASNTPIIAIDMDGLEAYFTHGTWGDNRAWLKKAKVRFEDGTEGYQLVPNELAQTIQQIFGNSESIVPTNDEATTTRGYDASWSGDNSDASRQKAAREYVEIIKKTHQKGEAITLIGHSHGGNVDVLIMNLLVEDDAFKDVELNLLTMNTPVREYELSDKAKERVNHYQVYNGKDVVQVSGAKNLFIFGSGHGKLTGEYGIARRRFEGAVNIKYDSPFKLWQVYGNHQGWRRSAYKIWLPALKKSVAASDKGSHASMRDLDKQIPNAKK